MKLIKRIILIAILVCFTISATIFIQILYTANNAKPQKSDVIIVLGCQIWGRIPSWLLEYRLEKALEIYQKNYAVNIIVSGGKGKDEPVSESNIMKSWLVTHGVKENRVIEEDKSTSTFENLKLSKEIMDTNKFKTAIIVSNDFHIYRSLRISKVLGIQASGGPAPTIAYLKPYYYCREILSVIKSYLLDR